MYGHPHYYPASPPLPAFTITNSLYRFPFPAVETKMLSQSIQSSRLLMRQGSMLLDRLGNATFARKVMEAAQQGNKQRVDNLIKSIGLSVSVTTRYTPSDILFTLYSPASGHSPISCCTLTLAMKWGLL